MISLEQVRDPNGAIVWIITVPENDIIAAPKLPGPDLIDTLAAVFADAYGYTIDDAIDGEVVDEEQPIRPQLGAG